MEWSGVAVPASRWRLEPLLGFNNARLDDVNNVAG